MAEAMEGWTRVDVPTREGAKTIWTKPELFLVARQALVELSQGGSVSSLVGWHSRDEKTCQAVRLRWRAGQADVHVICDGCSYLFSFPWETSSLEELLAWAAPGIRLAQVRAARTEAIREECLTGGGQSH